MDFEVKYFATDDEIKQMIALDDDSYSDGEDCGVLEKCLQWQKICPELYTFIKNKNEVVGYINFIPVTEDAYERFKSGKLKDYEMQNDDFRPFKVGKNYCLFMSIVVKENYRDKQATKTLLNAFYDRIEMLKNKNIFIDKVIADCVSNDGEKFISSRFGGNFICETETGSKIYEFHI